VTNRLEHDREVIPVVEERAVVRKRKKLTGGMRVRTVVRENEEVIDEPLTSEEVEVERVPLDCWVEAPVPVRQEARPRSSRSSRRWWWSRSACGRPRRSASPSGGPPGRLPRTSRCGARRRWWSASE
jgi:Domain of unknown function (DUF2382)